MSVSMPEAPPVPFLRPEEPAAEAARMIVSRSIGAVPVQDSAGRLVGLVSERDIVRVIASRAMGLRGLAVEEVMTRDPITLRPGTPTETALELMQTRGVGHLPVCSEEGRLLGLVGLSDLVRQG